MYDVTKMLIYIIECTVMGSRFVLLLNAAKNTDNIKNASNKNCSEFDFLQKSQWAHMSISPGMG